MAVNPPTATVLGGVFAKIAEAGYCVTGVNTSGELIFQPFPLMTQCCGSSDSGSGGSGGSGGGGGTGDTPTTIPPVSGTPTAPGTTDGEVKWDSVTGKLWIWNGTAWIDIFAYYAPNAPTGVQIVTALPATGNEGQTVYLTTDGKVYIRHNGAWVTIQSTYTPDATEAIVLVDALPTLPNTSYPAGATVYSRTLQAIFTNVSNTWTDVTHTLTPSAPSAVKTVTTLPTLPNTNYPVGDVVFNLSDSKLYKNATNSSWTAVPMQAEIAAGSITAGMIAANAIGTDQLAANAVSADKIGANAVTAGKIAAGAVSASQISAGAITSDKLASGSIVAGKIAAGAIGASELAAGVISTDKLASNFLISGSANISDASITTLKVAGEAITITRSATNLGYTAVSGGSYQTPLSLTFTLPYAAKAVVVFTGSGETAGAGDDNSHGDYWVRVDGANTIGWYVKGVMASTAQVSLAAGSHTISFVTNNSVRVGNLALVVQLSMR